MSYGLIIRNAKGEVTFTSENTLGGVYATTVLAYPGTSFTASFDGASYRDLRGKTIRAIQTGAGTHNWTVTQGATPSITFTARNLAGKTFSGMEGVTTLRIFAL